jgi:hypothetical protein
MSLVHEQLLAQDRYELGLPESLVISLERVALHAEYEVSLRIWHVVAEHGRQRLDERQPGLGVELVLDPRVDDDHVAWPQLPSLVPDHHRHRAFDDPHDLLRALMAVAPHRRTGLIRHVAEQHLLAADCAEPHTREEGMGLNAVPRSERRAQAGTSNRIPPLETEFTESSSSKTTFLPSRRGSPPPAAFASKARNTRSGVIGSSVTHTPTAS